MAAKKITEGSAAGTVVLYEKRGRAEPKPVGSWDADDKNLDAKVQAAKIARLNEAARSGAPEPELYTETR